MGDAGDLIVALDGAVTDLLVAVGGADPAWLGLGVVLHLANQLARARGWYAILAGACDEHAGLRRRDAAYAWIAGAGAGGLLSARGGDAVRVLLLSRRLRGEGCPVVAGTLVAEGAGDAAIGVAVIALAIALGAWPGFGLSIAGAWPWLLAAAAVAAAGLAVAVALHRRRGPAPSEGRSRVRLALADARRGCAPLAHPGPFCANVLPWQLASRVLRGAAIGCFLLAFGLPASVAAVLFVTLAQSGGRLLPLAPASVGATLAVLGSGFGAATGDSASAGALAAFLLGTTTVLTVVGVVVSAGILLACFGPRALASAVAAASAQRRAARVTRRQALAAAAARRYG